MSASPLTVLAYAAIPVSAAIAGSVLAAVRTPSATLRSGVQHVAAGVVFAAVAGELLPEVLRIHRPVQVIVGLAVGVGLLLSGRGHPISMLVGERDKLNSHHQAIADVSRISALPITVAPAVRTYYANAVLPRRSPSL